MKENEGLLSRREAMKRAMLGAGAVAIGTMGASATAMAADLSGNPGNLLPSGTRSLRALSERLARTPRRRDFKTVPMILTEPDQWDDAALKEVIHYAGGPKQVWDNTDLASPWLNLMRNSLNAQVWSFKHPDFLCVSATHGTAHFALYDDYLWDKYKLSKLTKDKYKENVFIKAPKAAVDDAGKFEDPFGVFSPKDNSIVSLQARGAVFLACHNGVFELSYKLHAKGVNPDKLTLPQMVAEFTNHLIPGAVLTPGIVGTIPELQEKGFHYA